MENRKPFQLRKIIIAYNLFQVILSAKLVYDAAAYGWLTSGDHAYNWRCQNIDRSPTGFPLLVSPNHLKIIIIMRQNFDYRWLEPRGFTTSASSPSSLTHSFL
jgi:GNS1/SUR4 family